MNHQLPLCALAAALLTAPLGLPTGGAPGPAVPPPTTLPSATRTAGTQDSPDLEQDVTAAERHVTGAPVTVSRGHLDFGPVVRGGQWRLEVRDDTVTPPVWREPEDVVIHVVDGSQLPVPSGPEYGFLGMAGGTKAYVVPQAQRQDVVWLGWNTQHPEAVRSMGRGVSLTFLRAQGPGRVSVFLQQGQVAGPKPLWGGTTPSTVWVDVSSHTHANWVFERPGVYLVEAQVGARTPDGRELTDRAVFRFAVGSATTAAAARAASLPVVGASGGTGGATTGPGARGGASDGGTGGGTETVPARPGTGVSRWLVLVVGGLLLVLLAAGAAAGVRRTRARRELPA